MIEKAINKILSMAPVQGLTFDGRSYTDKQIYPVKDPTADGFKVNTLTGLVDYVAANIDAIKKENCMIHVESYDKVVLMSGMFGSFRQRDIYISCGLQLKPFQFGQFMDGESFNIGLQSCFLDMGDRAKILALVGNIEEGAIKTTNDDGITQVVTAKVGIQRKAEVSVPNPVLLQPFRTFLEVRQPESLFVFRMQTGPRCALIEADGGAWKNEAIQNIKAWLQEKLPEMAIIA